MEHSHGAHRKKTSSWCIIIQGTYLIKGDIWPEGTQRSHRVKWGIQGRTAGGELRGMSGRSWQGICYLLVRWRFCELIHILKVSLDHHGLLLKGGRLASNTIILEENRATKTWMRAGKCLEVFQRWNQQDLLISWTRVWGKWWKQGWLQVFQPENKTKGTAFPGMERMQRSTGNEGGESRIPNERRLPRWCMGQVRFKSRSVKLQHPHRFQIGDKMDFKLSERKVGELMWQLRTQKSNRRKGSLPGTRAGEVPRGTQGNQKKKSVIFAEWFWYRTKDEFEWEQENESCC